MKDIKSVELEKYSGGDYERVAFRVFHNKAGRNYCICITADEMDEMILDDLMTQYELNCTNDHCGEETVIDGKKVFDVADGFLLACFDSGVTTETVTAIAKKKPYYAVFRDSSMANDSVATNFDQIFETYSPQTTRKVL